jgi:hypothetical protein
MEDELKVRLAAYVAKTACSRSFIKALCQDPYKATCFTSLVHIYDGNLSHIEVFREAGGHGCIMKGECCQRVYNELGKL